MKAGKLTETITIQCREIVKGPSGGESYEWKDFMRARASVVFQSGQQEEKNMGYSHNQTNKVTMYYRSAVRREMRIVYNGENYKINSINADRLKNMMVLTIELINE